MDLIELSLPGCGLWFDPPTEPCCEPHREHTVRVGSGPLTVEARVADGPTDLELAEMATSLLRAVWGPRWPGWVCTWAQWDRTGDCVDGLGSWMAVGSRLPFTSPAPATLLFDLDFPVVAVQGVTVDGVALAADRVEIVNGGYGLAYRTVAGRFARWPAVAVEALLRWGAVPSGASPAWHRLYCELRRIYRPHEGLAATMGSAKAAKVRQVTVPGGSIGYSDKEAAAGVLGWDPVVSAFCDAGLAQRDTTTGGGAMGGGVWAPDTRRPTLTSTLRTVP